MEIRKLGANEKPPMGLLLLADPSEKLVGEYVRMGDCYVAEINNEIIGVYVLLPKSLETIELMNVAVAENQQGKGYGKQLVMDAVEKAKKAGYQTIEVGTGNSGLGQLALYQKCGFRMFSIDRDFFTRNYSEDIFENGIQCVDMVRLSQKL